MSDEAKYRAIADIAVDAIIVIDEQGIIQAFKRSAKGSSATRLRG